MAGTCTTCGSALHSDLSRLHGRCGPCRSGEDAAAEPTWRQLLPPPRPAPEPQRKDTAQAPER